MPADDPLEARLPGHARVHATGSLEVTAPNPWLRGACGDYDGMITAMAETHTSAERRAVLYDRCAVESTAAVGRDEYLAAPVDPRPVAFALHRWLLDGGIEPDVARTLVRAIVFARDPRVPDVPGLRLPAAANADPLPDDEPTVVVARDRIWMGDKGIVPLDADGAVDPAAIEAGVIGVLHDALVEEQHRMRGGDSATNELVLAADRELPWPTIELVVRTAARAGCPRIRAAVLTDDANVPLRGVIVATESIGTVDPTMSWQSVVDRTSGNQQHPR